MLKDTAHAMKSHGINKDTPWIFDNTMLKINRWGTYYAW